MTVYEALAALAERELELAHAGEIERLAEIHAERSAMVAALPSIPPPSARLALARAAYLQARVSDTLAAGVREAGGQLHRLRHGRTAIAGYAPPDEQPKLVDRAG